MGRIGPPSKGTLSTTAATVNQLQPPQLVAPAAGKQPARIVAQRHPRIAPTAPVAARPVGQPRETAAAARVVAPPINKATRVVAASDDKTARVILIGCSNKKRPGRHPARALYQGALFKSALAHAQRIGAEAFIVSARHGLVELDTELDAYDYKLRSDGRESWAWSVCVALRREMKRRPYTITIFAGESYAQPLQKYLAAIDPTIEVVAPLAGLSLGAQLRWFRMAAALIGGVQ